VKHSTSKPTAREAERIVAAKEGACVACLILSERDELRSELVVEGCDYNHAKSGNVRRGHRYGYALCVWHHRRHAWHEFTPNLMRQLYGPSLMDGSALFHRTYGSDDELIAKQDEMIGWEDE
jgi:hypothetical protein